MRSQSGGISGIGISESDLYKSRKVVDGPGD